MKLHELLNSYKGQTVTDEMIKAISSSVDGVKADAIKREQEIYNKLKAETETTAKELDELKPKLREYEMAQKKTELKDAFVKAGGNAEKFEQFQRVAGNISDLKKYDFKKDFKDFPSLLDPNQEKAKQTTGTINPLNLGGEITNPNAEKGKEDEPKIYS